MWGEDVIEVAHDYFVRATIKQPSCKVANESILEMVATFFSLLIETPYLSA